MKISSLFLSVVTAFILLLGNKTFAATDIYFVHNDHLGTPQVLTNQEQNVVWQGDYKPFGEVDISVNNVELDARFPGQYQDSEAGVYYNYFRDYDPSLGRYIQSDPIGLEGGINTYGYVGANPIMGYDFFGLAEICSSGFPMSFNIPHTFLCAGGQCGGKHGGGDGPSLYSATSEIRDDSGDLEAGASCSDIPEQDCDSESFNACVLNELQVRSLDEPYYFSGQNCGTWATQTITKCRAICDKK